MSRFFPRWRYSHARGLANPIYLGVRHPLWLPVGGGGRFASFARPRARCVLPRAQRLLRRRWRPLLRRRRAIAGGSSMAGKLDANHLRQFHAALVRRRKLRDLQVFRTGRLVHSNSVGAELAISTAIPPADQESGRGLPLGASPLSFAGAARYRGHLASRPGRVSPCEFFR